VFTDVPREVLCEKVANHIIDNQLDINTLADNGFPVATITKVPNWEKLADHPTHARQLLVAFSKIPDSQINAELRQAINRCNSSSLKDTIASCVKPTRQVRQAVTV
jgi:hypothetical protein